LKETPYWYHQTLTLGQQIEDFATAKRILEKLFDSVEKEMGKRFDMGAVYIMGHQESKRVHFHVVFFIYGTPLETPDDLAVILRREVWKRWEKLTPGIESTANRLTIRTKGTGLWYLLTNHFRVGKTRKEKGQPNWYGLRNKRLIAANLIPVTNAEVRAKFDEFFPVLKPTPVAKKPKGIFYDRRRLADLRYIVEYRDKSDWDDFKRAQTGKKGKVGDVDFMNFLNRGASVTPKNDDGNTL